jgi:hypothetical protein
MVPTGMAANEVIFEPRSSLASSAINASAALLTWGRVHDAIESSREAIRYEPRFVLAYERSRPGAHALRPAARGRRGSRVGISHDPNTASLHTRLGIVRMRLGDNAAAAAELNRAWRWSVTTLPRSASWDASN